MDNEMLEQFQIIIQGIAGMENRLAGQIQTEIRESETRTRIFIENQVPRQIDSLFDGYKLVHEKQWELEQQTEALKAQVYELAARLSALESTTV